MTPPEQDEPERLEDLRDAVSKATDRIRFIRYSEAAFEVASSKIWIRAPSRAGRKWTAHFFMGSRHQFDTIDEVVEWLRKQPGLP